MQRKPSNQEHLRCRKCLSKIRQLFQREEILHTHPYVDFRLPTEPELETFSLLMISNVSRGRNLETNLRPRLAEDLFLQCQSLGYTSNFDALNIHM